MVHVTVSCLDGCQVRQELEGTSLVSALHHLVLQKLDTPQTQDTTRLVHISGRCLDADKTLQEESIRDKDELILIRRRLKEPSDNSEKDNPVPEVPNSVVEEVMRSLPEVDITNRSGVTEKQPESNNANHILLMRIIVTLVDCAEMLQYDRLQESESQVMFNEEDVKQIVDIGFSEEEAKRALTVNSYNLSSAIEWLLAGHHTSAQAAGGSGGDPANRPRRRRGIFKADPVAVRNLKEMGFPEPEVLAALELTRNNQQEACSHLLGDMRSEGYGANEMYVPLPKDHPLYRLVMERIEIQKALLSTKFLDAMRDLEDRKATIVDFSDDPEIGPIFFQISKAIQKFSSQS